MKIEKLAEFSKVKDGIAYGWAIVSTIKGEPYVDLQGDWIPPETLAPVAAEFMARSRVGKDMHEGDPIADVVFCLPVDGDVEKGVGLRDEQDRTGLVIGWKPSDPALLAKIASGERIGFSIGGVITDAEEKSVKKGARTDKANQHKRTFRSWKLLEISLVDQPAQEGALVGIVKRRPLAIVKSDDKRYLTDEVMGHAHEAQSYAGQEPWMSDATAEGAQGSHRHIVIRQPDGSLTVLADSGHTHVLTEQPKVIVVPDDTAVVSEEVAARAPQESPPSAKSRNVKTVTKETTMDPAAAPTNELADLKALNVKLQAKIAELEAANADATVQAGLTDADKAHLATLTAGEAKRFRSLEKSARDAEVAKALESNPVVATIDGVEYRKSTPGAQLAVKLAEQIAESNAIKVNEIAKSTIGNYPGDLATHRAIVKAINGSGETAETIAKMLESLRGPNAVLAAKAKAPGFGGSESTDNASPQAEFDAGVAKLATERSITIAKATEVFSETAKGKSLYAEIRNGKSPRA